MQLRLTPFKNRAGFSLMEVLVGIAIIIILASIAYPIWMSSRQKANRAMALRKMEQLGTALARYTGDNNGLLPKEEADSGQGSWEAASRPDADDAWYNALPRLAGGKGTGDYFKEGNPAAFYAKDSLLALEGVKYPKTQMRKPMYAFAYNTKLHRKDATTGQKPRININKVANPSRVVALIEQGLKNEKRPIEGMKSYDRDDCKASPRQFVTRWSDHGMLVFLDGHVEQVKAAQVLDSSAGIRIKWNATDTSGIFWCPDVNEDPN